MAYRYTNEQKAQALILLAANRGNTELTSAQTGVSRRVLEGWAERERSLPSPDIGKGMEVAIHHLLGQIPNLVNKYNIAELLGTLLEKWLHYQGIPQNSTQTILAVLATKSEGELDRMISDIDSGRQLALTSTREDIAPLEKELARMGMIGLSDRNADEEVAGPKAVIDAPTEVIDLIEYQTYDDPQEKGNDDDW